MSALGHAPNVTFPTWNETEPSIEVIGRAPPVLPAVLLDSRILRGLRVLIQAYEYAANVGVSPRQFAVKLTEARLLGLTLSDLRWLVMKRWVEPLIETTLPADDERSFRPIQTLRFPKRASFALTPAGFAAAKGPAMGLERAPQKPLPELKDGRRIVPQWDAVRKELRFDGLVVKRFKAPAPNQETVLTAFEEEAWPPRIFDPLPPFHDQDPKRRLHDTIVSLNRTLTRPLIRFSGDGSGEGVRWTSAGE
jgi:hypothetical protein